MAVGDFLQFSAAHLFPNPPVMHYRCSKRLLGGQVVQVFSINISDELAGRLDEASRSLDLNQAEVLQDAIQGKIEELEQMAGVMAILEEQGSTVPPGGTVDPGQLLWHFKG